VSVMDFNSLKDLISGSQPGTTKAVKELNKIHMSPAAKATAANTLKAARAAAGGLTLGHTVAELIPQQAYDRVANEVVRGAVTVFGGDTTLMDARISGKPLVKSVGGTDFNVATNEGMAAYRRALNATKADDPKRTRGGGLDTRDGKVKENPNYVNMENVNTLLGGLGIKKFTPNAEFNSNQLPTTSSNPNEDFSPEDAQVMGVSKNDARLMQSGGGVETVFTDGKESSTQIFKDPGSRAFLDYDGGSMGAFRAAERARGMVRVGGKNYITNPLAGQDGESDFRAITDQERRDVNAGRITAQDLSNQYIQRITGADTGIVSDNLQTMGVPEDYRDALERDDEVFFDIGPNTETVVTPIPKFSDPFSSKFDPNLFID